jgi:hypothetical protein
MNTVKFTEKTGTVSNTEMCSATETIISKNYPFNHEQDKSWLSPSLGANGGVIY